MKGALSPRSSTQRSSERLVACAGRHRLDGDLE
jgi:hypothetical protein